MADDPCRRPKTKGQRPKSKRLMESDLIAYLRERIGPHPLVQLGIGDDAAILSMAGVKQCVLTVDLLTDGVDFELSKIDPRRAGRVMRFQLGKQLVVFQTDPVRFESVA